MLVQAASQNGQRNRCLEVICLPQVREFERSNRSERIAKPKTGRECFNCGKTGHLARDCEVRQKCTRCGKVGHTSRSCELTPRCSNCGKVGHSTRNCFHPKRLATMSDSNETSVKTIHEEVMVCVAHDRENCFECTKTAKKCHAMLATELTLECGCKLPVVADACQVHNERMPVCIA